MSLNHTSHLLDIAENSGIGSSQGVSKSLVSISESNDLFFSIFGDRSHSNLMLSHSYFEPEILLSDNYHSENIIEWDKDITGFQEDTTQSSSGSNTWDLNTYFNQVEPFSYEDSSHVNEVNSGSSSTTTSDWFSQNLKDQQILIKTRSLAADGQLSRTDMIAIFRDAKDGNVIDSNELKDLRTIVSNASYFKMQDHVRVLSNKIVNGDIANKKYQGTSLSDLYSGSSGEHMEKLVGKWFLGSDRPAIESKYQYQLPKGSLFSNGISYKDINQGALGDCYFLAGLGEIAFRSPQTIQSMFIDNGDNTYTVRFSKNGVADYVTVDKYLPIDASGFFAYAQPGEIDRKYNDPNNELWVALAEKAYAQLNESGWIGQNNTNSYKGIEGGSDGDVVTQITGRKTSYSTSFNLNTMVSAFNSGSLIGVSSKDYAYQVASNIVPNHAYFVIGYNSSTQKFKLYNPWGEEGGTYEGQKKPGIVDVSVNELIASFSGWSRTIT